MNERYVKLVIQRASGQGYCESSHSLWEAELEARIEPESSHPKELSMRCFVDDERY